MKIAFICNEFPPQPHGGIGTFVEAVAHGLAARGHQITVVGLGDKDSHTFAGPIKVVTLASDRRPVIGNLITRLRLRSWLVDRTQNGELDLVEAPDYMGLLPFGAGGCAIVIRLHNTDTAIKQANGQVGGRGIRWYERRTLAVNGNWIAVSKHIMELTQSTFKVTPKRSEVILNPVPSSPQELPVIPHLPDNYVLYVGAVTHLKGALVLATALHPLLHARPDLHLVYVGAVMRENGRQVSEEVLDLLGREVAERVHFLGRVPRELALAWMKHARVFAFPSRFEALGIVVLEAMNAGVPVVCTSHPPGPEMVEDEVTGLLADPESPREVGEKIRRILDDRKFGMRLATHAKHFVTRRFSVEVCLDSTERFYASCVGRSA